MSKKYDKCNVVIRIASHTTEVIKERGFIDIDEAEHMYCFLEDIADECDIFFRRDWEAGEDMPIDGEYWFGKREAE